MTDADNSARIGADVGGTFTDVILQHADGSATIRKLLSTPPNYDAAVIEAVAGLTNGTPVEGVVHGTTVATNAVLEHRGALTALVTTAGFRDVLELRRLRIPRMYEPFWRKPEPLVPRRLRFEIGERMGADGTVMRALDADEARAVAGAAARGRRRVGRRLPAPLVPAIPSTRSGSARSCARSCPASRSRSRARSCASSASTSAPRRRS